MTVLTISSEAYRDLAKEVLEAFERIAAAARVRLRERRGNSPLDAFAAVNPATADKVLKSMAALREGREVDWQRLTIEPAIARLVVANEDEGDRRETFYVTRGGTVDPTGVRLCSYLSPKGALASLKVGDGRELTLPGGKHWFRVLERVTFSPSPRDYWDARPAVIQEETGLPTTIRSLRDLLRDAGLPSEALDELDRMMSSDQAASNVFRGLQREIQTAMQLRVQAVLDEVQSDIFRLPLDTHLVLLGPAGTGKTTTLIKRLRQKIDWQHLDDDERRSVGEENAAGHSISWLMFTPTELLKRYVQEAFNREDVPAPAGRIRTWTEYRTELARRHLSILRSRNGAGLVMKDGLGVLDPATVANQISWFEAFESFQRSFFVDGLMAESVILRGSLDHGLAVSGERLTESLGRVRDRPMAALAELAGQFDALQRAVASLREFTRKALRQPLALHLRRDPDALDALARFVGTLAQDGDDAIEEGESDGDEEDDDEAVPVGGRRAAEAAFVRALRARAIGLAGRRTLARGSRAARTLAWIEERGIDLPPLEALGAQLLVLRAATRLLRAPQLYLRQLPARYRQFRRVMQAEGRWYLADAVVANDVDPLEVDLVLLAMLRGARNMREDTSLMQRLGQRVPSLIETVYSLTRHQILVDEATDFSPLQLACMAGLAAPRIESFFACGDFNQRLTLWGSRSEDEFLWVLPDMQIRRVETAYRQSRRLTEFAAALAFTASSEQPRSPKFVEHEGVPVAFGGSLDQPEKLAQWLSSRIREVERLTGEFPSIAVLVNDKSELEPLARALNEALEDINLRATACPDGQALGAEGDVRLFEAEHIKGLQFEAVFFANVDNLATREPELFEKYLYVGATRAATYLGLTCAGPKLPAQLGLLDQLMADSWST